MHQLTTKKRSIGVTFSAENLAQVLVWAPHANHVALKINGQPAALPLQQETMGYWHLKTSQLSPDDLYTFVLDGENERSDPASLCQPQGVFGPSKAINTAFFEWEDQSWVNPALENYLLYEIHVGTFTPEGTLLRWKVNWIT